MVEEELPLKKKLKMYQGLEAMLNRVSPEVCNVIDLGAFLQATVEELGRTMDVCRCEVLMRESRERLKVIHEYRRHDVLPVYLGRTFPAKDLLSASDGAALEEVVAVDEAVSGQTPPAVRSILQGRDIRSAMIVPISFKDELLAVAGLYHCRRPYRWSTEEINFLKSISQQVAIAFQYTRLYTEKEREVETTRTLLEIANDVTSRTDSLEVTSFIVHKAVQMLGARSGCLALMNGSGRVLQPENFINASGETVDAAGLNPVLLSEYPVLRDAMRAGQVLFINGDELQPGAQKLAREVFGGKAVLLTPLIVSGEVFGALCLVWEEPFPAVTQPQMALAEGLANQMSLSLERDRLSAEVLRLRRELGGARAHQTIVGDSEVIKRCVQMALNVASGMTTVLVNGESGTGKELIADLIHRNSPRHDKPYVKINCGAIPEALMESELFGHEKGAFTGADSRRIGRFEEADGGTLFLDEIGELSLAAQVKLLRVLQNGELTRVGGNRTIKTDVRVIAATNIDLEEALRQHRLREDLYYRLNVYPIRIPPLRERKEDIPLLAGYLLELYKKRNNKYIAGISEEAMSALRAYDWPGNIRELENALERAVWLAKTRLITIEDLPEKIGAATGKTLHQRVGIPLGITLAEAKNRLIRETLNLTGGDKAKAARILGIGRKTLYRHLKEYS